MARPTNASDQVLKQLREFGLAYPGAHTKSPWPGHLDLAVNDKTFAYLGIEGEPFHISCKLPHSSVAALTMFPFTKPTAYGLGKSGWVSAEFPEGQVPPLDLMKAWIDESYRAQAPKKLVAQLESAVDSSSAPAKATTAKVTLAKNTVRTAKAAAAKKPAPAKARAPSTGAKSRTASKAPARGRATAKR